MDSLRPMSFRQDTLYWPRFCIKYSIKIADNWMWFHHNIWNWNFLFGDRYQPVTLSVVCSKTFRFYNLLAAIDALATIRAVLEWSSQWILKQKACQDGVIEAPHSQRKELRWVIEAPHSPVHSCLSSEDRYLFGFLNVFLTSGNVLFFWISIEVARS